MVILVINTFQVFMNVLKKKQAQSKGSFVWAVNNKGKPVKLLTVPQTQLGSSEASPSSVRKRSQVIENVAMALASPTCCSKDLTTQQSSTIKRNKDQFVKSAEAAGLRIISKFSLKQVNIKILNQSYNKHGVLVWLQMICCHRLHVVLLTSGKCKA